MTTQTDAFLVDWNNHSTFGAVKGTNGVDRQAATLADAEQRRWLADLLEGSGFTVLRDEIGNQFGLLELVPGAPYVVAGSHLDSQPTAGRFDGAYGVVAAAHACIQVATEYRRSSTVPYRNLAVVNWFNEEGSRFKPSMMGSSVFTGKLSLQDALATTDSAGITVRDALNLIGERGKPVTIPIAAYVEIHVEQGRSMEEGGLKIGLVNATWGAHKYEIRVRGEQAHSGSALMSDRRDALLGAARLVVATRELVDEFPPGRLHTAVGELNVYPNSPVVVASEVRLLLDLRSPDQDILTTAAVRTEETVAAIESMDGLKIDVVSEHSWAQNPYSEEGISLAAGVAADLELPHGRIMTIAGHDSTNLKDQTPTIMLFVPSVAGISHNLNEYTHDADLVDGLRMMTGVLHRLVRD